MAFEGKLGGELEVLVALLRDCRSFVMKETIAFPSTCQCVLCDEIYETQVYQSSLTRRTVSSSLEDAVNDRQYLIAIDGLAFSL